MDNFVEDLKASVEQARRAPEGKGDMMSLYGTSYSHGAFTFDLTMLQVWAVQAQWGQLWWVR